MPFVKSGRIVEDRFVRIADDAPVPEGGAIIVSGARYLADADAFRKRTAPTGVVWPNNRPIAELAPHLDRLAVVAVVFPGFRDGRGYSQARVLRESYGFKGELRATGQVLRDQFLLLLRAGFDSFEVSKDADATAFADSIRRFDVFYQPTGDGRVTVLRRRLGRVGNDSCIEVTSRHESGRLPLPDGERVGVRGFEPIARP
jgi:uncharacterized protein (DUF934 family)